jgi:hypothetical protein
MSAHTVTVAGYRYDRVGSGWRCIVGARSHAVGPRFCAMLDRIWELEQQVARINTTGAA